MVTLLLTLALPLFGALLMLLAGRRLPHTAVSVLCCGTVLGAFACVVASPDQNVTFAPWLPSLNASWGLRLDALSRVMALVITGVGFLIHVYSASYMKEDAGFYRYFGYFNFFVFAMLLLVLANNYVLMFAGWEGVGLASYLLIGFWFHRPAAAAAGMKAFIVNRVGDAGLLLAILAIQLDVAAAPWIAALLVVGAIGKSAQFPLHVWLPDAMEGPTPVSALIHAATMVTAGVYLIARSHAIFESAAQISTAVAWIGAFSALFAATVAMAQNDIKRVLAWSTVSQLGYMFLALGSGAYGVAIFHMITHAFFKALLFLCAGNVIHAVYGEQDLLKMGGMRSALPKTHALMLVGAASAAGVPGLAGFFSKDAILASAWSAPFLFIAGLATALLTAIYMTRLMYLIFHGPPREERLHMHEPPSVMIAPLVVLALGAIAAGYFGPQSFLAASVGPGRESGAPELLIMALSMVAAAAGWWFARTRYLNAWPAFLRRAYFIDEIYDAVFVRGAALGGALWLNAFDARVIDGGINGAGWLTRLASRVSIWWDAWIVDGLVRVTAFLVKMSSYPFRFVQSGYVQFYALVMLAGLITFVGYLFAR